MRNRLGAYCADNFREHRHEIAKLIERETGVRLPLFGQAVSLDRFFQTAEIRDVLDAITLIAMLFVHPALRKQREDWVRFVTRVFVEEKVAYSLDEKAVVHFSVDAAYVASRASVISGLSKPRWQLARQEMDHAFDELDASPARTNSAIRSAAAAVETVAKTVLGAGVARVGPAEIEKHLWPIFENKYRDDEHGRNAAHAALKSYSDWVTATHQYRHGQSSEDGATASEEFAIWAITIAASIIRWIISELAPN